MATLLEELQEDLIKEALAAPAAKRPSNEWHEPVSWTFTGYVARCKLIQCPSCGSLDWVSEGVFAEEKASNGTRRLTSARQFPTDETDRRMETTRVMGSICWRCLSESFGFDNIIEAPEIVTNVAGEGFTASRPKAALCFTRKGD